ncbi:MAG: hypothetical protein KatS3mg121_0895 [Gammaproteobacteria bacterium]|nr:MAG: hypothetical protein KatS3mg121_0895 [Gammaproteobacteria bacterium]
MQLNFGGDGATLGGIPYSGNIGVRYVRTVNESSGGITLPSFEPDELVCEPTPAPGGGGAPPVPFTLGCYLDPDDVAFADGEDIPSVVEAEHSHTLPSFNVKFNLTEEWLLRFAASRAMARPDIGLLRNYLGVSKTTPDQNDPNDPLWIKDENGDIIGAQVRYTGSAHNPFLEPMTAEQFDLSLEWYFADVGSATLTLFKKDFNDYVQVGRYLRDVTNNGVTRTVEVTGPIAGDGASIKGYEIAYQTFFDFLPGFWSGFGVQLNYTSLDNQGITNPNLRSAQPDADAITDQAPDTVQVSALEGLSDDSYSAILMYEYEKISARLAYSWRSEYLVTAIDCCVAYPVWQDEYGQVDLSFAYHLTDNVQLHIQGSNVTGEETVLYQQVTNDADGRLLLPNAWFQNDKRYTIGLRLNF